MAGDWIKWVKGLIRRPEVIQAAGALNKSRHDIASRWMDLMEWTDENVSEADRVAQTDDALVKNLTPEIIDDLVGLPEFARAMSSAGWLAVRSADVVFVNYFRHNDETAKDRALGAKRAAKRRERDAERDESNAESVTPSVTREEKRREEKSHRRPPNPPLPPQAPQAGPVASSASAVDSGLTGEQRAVFEYLTLAEVGRFKATELAMNGLTMADARRVNDARKVAGKPADGKFVAQLKAAAAAAAEREKRRRAMSPGGAA